MPDAPFLGPVSIFDLAALVFLFGSIAFAAITEIIRTMIENKENRHGKR